mmetsp:Transcript_48/g.134  ORF Transcript_48/g.134 Transcript_48/m.134 type:complete len:236 (+) Transcript_48:1374-2081(+)
MNDSRPAESAEALNICSISALSAAVAVAKSVSYKSSQSTCFPSLSMTALSLNWRSPLLTLSMKLTKRELASFVLPLFRSISTICAACPRSASSTCGASATVSTGAASLGTSLLTAGAEAIIAGAGIRAGPWCCALIDMPMPIMGPIIGPPIMGPIIGPPIMGPMGPVLDIDAGPAVDEAAPAGPTICACCHAPSMAPGAVPCAANSAAQSGPCILGPICMGGRKAWGPGPAAANS